MTWTVLGPALRRMVSAAVTLCMVVAFNLPSAIPAAAASAAGLSRASGPAEFVLFEGEHQDAAYTAGAQSGAMDVVKSLSNGNAFAGVTAVEVSRPTDEF